MPIVPFVGKVSWLVIKRYPSPPSKQRMMPITKYGLDLPSELGHVLRLQRLWFMIKFSVRIGVGIEFEGNVKMRLRLRLRLRVVSAFLQLFFRCHLHMAIEFRKRRLVLGL